MRSLSQAVPSLFKTLGLADCQAFQQLRSCPASYRVPCWHRFRRPCDRPLLLRRPPTMLYSFQNKTQHFPEISGALRSIYAAQAFGDNEDSVHSLVDRLVLEPMKVVGETANCAFMMNRNGSDASGATINSLRPDVLLWLPSGILAFKGEDKATAADRNLARNELVNKLNSFTDTFFGQVPYQLCYNAGGHMLEFVAINRNPVGRPTLHSLAPVIDLSNARGRSLCVRYAVNIARVLVSLSEAFPDGNVIRLGEKIATGSSTVLIMGDYAIKKTNTHSGSVLVELYAQIHTLLLWYHLGMK